MIVVDASAFVEVLDGSPLGAVVQEVLAREPSAAPHLFDAEVLHRLITAYKRGLLSPAQLQRGTEELRRAPMKRYDHRPRLHAATLLSSALSGYDSLYAALALELGADLVTADERFARTARSQLGIAVRDLSR